MSKVISVAGKEYLVRYPVGALIKAEAHLGKPMSEVPKTTLTYKDMAIITRYGLHNLDGVPISDKDFESLLDNTSVEEFGELFTVVVSEFAPSDTKQTGKN